jgi:hypothetical protein
MVVLRATVMEAGVNAVFCIQTSLAPGVPLLEGVVDFFSQLIKNMVAMISKTMATIFTSFTALLLLLSILIGYVFNVNRTKGIIIINQF